ncbi:hypothetical protein PHSY_001415 [Pseudozyma hubeiensis SY62]|uniref:Uncharacterized protein n=1 Tax=Pseudozyma hubeiensis (strain SY62) TaxID=1305764 RepID=R9P706_PSEHS|nr:hypothetical protein PHSY_001415 [Pseudozyma hubeiensis SY62]GAC93850.1 hypothetical protein PHSY_001415 [Pseudozyma hubeiensis SY62]
MLASTSTASTALLCSPTTEGLKHLYRTILQQARLLSVTLNDPVLYTSHRFLARKNLEPLLSSGTLPLEQQPQWPPSTAFKKLRRSQTHRRHLADANFGWPHSVHRALSLAYARSGKLRRDVLTDLTAQSASAFQGKKRVVSSPILRSLLTSQGSMNGATVKNREHLTGRPPPPFLPAMDDPLVKYFGKAVSRKRVENARGKFLKTYLRKVRVPVDVIVAGGGEGTEEGLWKWLEEKARPPAGQTTLSRNSVGRDRAKSADQPFHHTARLKVDTYRSNFNTSAHRSRGLRVHGWASHPVDFSHPRKLRRLYADLLDETPLLFVESSLPQSQPSTALEPSKNDPLGIRAKLSQTTKPTGGNEVKFKVVRSRYSVGPKMRGVDVMPRRISGEVGAVGEIDNVKERLHASEIAFLTRQGLL